MTYPAYGEKPPSGVKNRELYDRSGALPTRSPHRVLAAGRTNPTLFDRLIGATNLAFAAFLVLSNLILPVIGRLPADSPAVIHGIGPDLFTLLLAVLIAIAGFEKWTGRCEWALVLATRCAPQTRGDPLAYTLLVVLTWLFWKGFAYGAAIVALFYVGSSLLRATGHL